jgi:iron complex outermembrane receptor protein
LANGAKVIGAIRGHYQTESLTGLEFTAPEYQSAYWMVDAQIGYHAPGSRYTISAFVNNMFDETVKSNAFPVPFTIYTSTSLRPPRVFGVRSGFSF